MTIIDKDYIRWVEDLSIRYRQSQIKAAVRVNRELLKYYWELGRDIEEMHVIFLWIYNARIPTRQVFLEPTYITQRNSIFFILSI